MTIYATYAEKVGNDYKYMTKDEINLLYDVARICRKRRPVFVNIGVGAGTSSMAMREACPRAAILSIDDRLGGPFGGMTSEMNVFEAANLKLPIQVLGDSSEVGKRWNDMYEEKADLIFVDAGHMYHLVVKDINAWFPNLADHGFILFHDYGSNDWPGVKQAIDELIKIPLYAQADTLVVYFNG